jgi:hypothetical protein
MKDQEFSLGDANVLSTRLLHRLPEVDGMYHRLLLVVGPPRSGKTKALTAIGASRAWPYISVNLQLAERLLDLTQKQRAVRVPGLLEDIVRATGGEIVLLDNVEMLFAVELAQDPLRLLQSLSRNRTVVAAWPGTFDGHALSYAEPGHREFKRYTKPQAVIVPAYDTPPPATARPEETA